MIRSISVRYNGGSTALLLDSHVRRIFGKEQKGKKENHKMRATSIPSLACSAQYNSNQGHQASDSERNRKWRGRFMHLAHNVSLCEFKRSSKIHQSKVKPEKHAYLDGGKILSLQSIEAEPGWRPSRNNTINLDRSEFSEPIEQMYSAHLKRASREQQISIELTR